MLDIPQTIRQCEQDASILHTIRERRCETVGEIRAVNEVIENTLGLADILRAESQRPKPESTIDCLLQRIGDYFQEMIDELQESGSDHAQESALLDEINSHFSAIFNLSEEGQLELNAENLAAAAKAKLVPQLPVNAPAP